jgi:hypothetical protein
MKSILAAAALLFLCAGVTAATENPVVRDSAPSAVIAEFSQAIPPEPPVVGEIHEHGRATTGAACCSMKMKMKKSDAGKDGMSCACCQNRASQTNAKKK